MQSGSFLTDCYAQTRLFFMIVSKLLMLVDMDFKIGTQLVDSLSIMFFISTLTIYIIINLSTMVLGQEGQMKKQIKDQSAKDQGEQDNLEQNLADNDDQNISGQNIEGNDVMEQQNEEDVDDYKNRLSNKGVCYISKIPPYMKPNYIRKLLITYGIERIYLLPQNEWSRKNRVRKGGNKKICFREGWVEFTDKRMAKFAAMSLNGQKMLHKKGSFYSEDIWHLKYLPKFKWYHLTERLAHQERLKKERLKVELQQEKKIEQFYYEKISKSNIINGIIKRKQKKGVESYKLGKRQFTQQHLVDDIKDK